MMKKYLLFTMLFVLALNGFANDKPNIVLLFVDDLGWADLGYRNEIFDTPNVDRLKAEGVDFSRAYIATPTCSPSRASLMTGKEAVRLQMPRHITHENHDGTNTKEFNYWESDPAQNPSRNWLPLEEVTYAERLKEFGYYNKFIGKWHLGHEPYHPIHQGFDDQYGTGNFGHPKSYYQPYFRTGPKVVTEAKKDEYLTDALTDHAVKFISGYDKAQPFMMSMWYYGVHGPHVARKDLMAKYKAKGLTGAYCKYATMIEAMDESVGRIRKAIADKGIEDNTVVIFLSDQGGLFTNAPLSGGKRGGNTLGEGGARVPMIVYYPNNMKAGMVCDVPVQSVDVFPTVVEIASGKPCREKGIQGVSVLPLLKGEKTKERNLYFYRSYEDQYCSIISGDWKMIKYRSGKKELFHLANDVSEKNNLMESNPQMAKKLAKALAKWEKQAVVESDTSKKLMAQNK